MHKLAFFSVFKQVNESLLWKSKLLENVREGVKFREKGRKQVSRSVPHVNILANLI